MDPYEASGRWQRWAVSGTGAQIDQVLASLDEKTPLGWRRLIGEESTPFQSLVSPGSGLYAIAPTPDHAGATLSLDRLKDSELRGGRIWFERPTDSTPTANVPAVWDQVNRLLDEAIVPAAKQAGATVRLPTSEDVFFAELPSEARERLQSFSTKARKSLPLNREEAEAWREFVVAAFRTSTVVDAELLVKWLVAKSWPREQAEELNSRFLDQCLLLAQYAGELSTV